MAIPSVMKPAGRQWWVTLLWILLLLIQMLTALIVYGGLFIVSNKVFISPFRYCLLQQDAGGLLCQPASGPALPETHVSILRTTAILGVYSPLVMVAFALLAMLLSAYGEDQEVQWCSVLCLAVSSLFTLVGLTAFVGLYWRYVSLTDMTVWFYVCLCVPAQLALTARLALPVRMEADSEHSDKVKGT